MQKATIKSQFCQNLRTLRGERSQREMAEKFGVSNVAWTYWETGRHEPPLAVIIELCESHAVSADWLLGIQKKESDLVAELRQRAYTAEAALAAYREAAEKMHNLGGATNTVTKVNQKLSGKAQGVVINNGTGGGSKPKPASDSKSGAKRAGAKGKG